MTGTDLVLTITLFCLAGGIAGIACAIGEKRLQRKQADWISGNGMRPQR